MNRFITGQVTYLGQRPQDSSLYSSSKLNPFVPFNALFNGKTITKGQDKTLIYSIPVLVGQNVNKVRKYLHAANHMQYSVNIVNLTTSRNTKSYQISKGILSYIDENFEVNPLIVLAVKSEAIYSLDRTNLDSKQFCLIINNDVFHQEHALMFKNMRKFYVDIITSDGVDVLYTSDMKKWLYNSLDYIPKFNTVTDMLTHLDTISNLALDIETQTENGRREIEIIDDTIPLPF